MWRKDFDFRPDITLTPKEKTNYKRFYDTDELIDFLKGHGVRLDDPKYPLTVMLHGGNGIHHTLGMGVYDVTQWSLLGWVKDDSR